MFIVLNLTLLVFASGEQNSKLVREAKQKKWALWSFANGLGELPKALERHLYKANESVYISLNTHLEQISMTNSSLEVNKFLFLNIENEK